MLRVDVIENVYFEPMAGERWDLTIQLSGKKSTPDRGTTNARTLWTWGIIKKIKEKMKSRVRQGEIIEDEIRKIIVQRPNYVEAWTDFGFTLNKTGHLFSASAERVVALPVLLFKKFPPVTTLKMTMVVLRKRKCREASHRLLE